MGATLSIYLADCFPILFASDQTVLNNERRPEKQKSK
jgi:hypothetical protein